MAKRKVRAVPRRAKKKTPVAAGPSTALARPQPARIPQVLPPDSASTTLSENAAVGALGLVELTLTEKEEAILAEAVDAGRVLVKPTGEAYLSHPEYTRWLNRAFGRTGWSLRPASKPATVGNSVVCAYLLYVHGQPVAYAVGEQEYFEHNARQSYGEALESTFASGLRRCAKRLGIGLELWDKRWLAAFEREHVIRVRVTLKDRQTGGEKQDWWFRRKDDPPFYQERSRQREEAPPRQSAPPAPGGQGTATQPPPPPPVAHSGREDEPITEPQRKRLWAILKHSGRAESEYRVWIAARFGYQHSKEIKRRDYETICDAIENKGALPMPVEREPGEDD